ncbi:MAG: phosphoenolpyruvate-utilizing N-terminal domain-containing protein, partial [Gluconacetobacter liquefaciens]
MKTTDTPDQVPLRRRRRPRSAATATAEIRLSGDATVGGVAIGPAMLVLESPAPDIDASARTDDPDHELARLAEAIERSVRQIERLRDRLAILPEDGQIEIGSLLEVYRRMLGPSRLQRGIHDRIVRDGGTAALGGGGGNQPQGPGRGTGGAPNGG